MSTEKKRRLRAEREAYEKILSSLKDLNLKSPKRGWIRTIREMLGMSLSQLGIRSGLDPTTISRLESNEIKDSITLNTLKKLADSLECELVYALVPKTRFIDILGERAEKIIKGEAKRAEHTMALEDQGRGEISSTRLAIRKAMLVEALDKRLWEE